MRTASTSCFRVRFLVTSAHCHVDCISRNTHSWSKQVWPSQALVAQDDTLPIANLKNSISLRIVHFDQVFCRSRIVQATSKVHWVLTRLFYISSNHANTLHITRSLIDRRTSSIPLQIHVLMFGPLDGQTSEGIWDCLSKTEPEFLHLLCFLTTFIASLWDYPSCFLDISSSSMVLSQWMAQFKLEQWGVR